MYERRWPLTLLKKDVERIDKTETMDHFPEFASVRKLFKPKDKGRELRY